MKIFITRAGSRGMNRPLVSAIEPSRNSAKTLEVYLKPIRAQAYQNVEVIVIDLYSRDGTRNVARSARDLQLTFDFRKEDYAHNSE